MENDNDDHDMSADSATSQAVKGSIKQGEGESDNYDDDEAPKRLPNELLDKIINFALTGTELSVITTFSSLSQLGDRIECLASHYICRLPRISYSHKDIPSKSFHSIRKLRKEFGPCSGLVLALKKIIGSSKWIKHGSSYSSQELELGCMSPIYGGKDKRKCKEKTCVMKKEIMLCCNFHKGISDTS